MAPRGDTGKRSDRPAEGVEEEAGDFVFQVVTGKIALVPSPFDPDKEYPICHLVLILFFSILSGKAFPIETHPEFIRSK